MAVYQIQLSTVGPQQFNTVINSVLYYFTCKWNTAMGAWTIDIADSNQNPIVQGITMAAGIDMLGQYEYLGLGFKFYCSTIGSPNVPPTFANLGAAGQLFVEA